MDKRIKDKFAQAVHCGHEVSKAEAGLRDAENRLQLARLELQEAEKDLLALLPPKPNTKTRLSFALASCATAEAILDQLV